MKLFSCQGCGQLLYFENVRCENCGRALGYLPDITEISALDAKPDGGWTALAAPRRGLQILHEQRRRACATGWCRPTAARNFAPPAATTAPFPTCRCRATSELWGKLETAKHRLFYSLLRLGLPLENRNDDPEHGLAFDFLQDPPESHAQGVMTGHDNGLITLAVREADDAVREKVRGEMGEPYRTLLGHFRHESGHYFWDRLVATRAGLAGCLPQPVRRRPRWITTRRCRSITTKARRPTGRTTMSASMPPPIPGRISPRPGRITCTSSTRWKRRALSA